MIWTILILVWFLILTLHSTKKMAYKSFKAGIKYGTDNYDALVGYKGIKHFEYKHCKPLMNPQKDEYLAELMFDIPLQDLSAYQQDKLTELQAYIDTQVTPSLDKIVERLRKGEVLTISPKQHLSISKATDEFVGADGIYRLVKVEELKAKGDKDD